MGANRSGLAHFLTLRVGSDRQFEDEISYIALVSSGFGVRERGVRLPHKLSTLYLNNSAVDSISLRSSLCGSPGCAIVPSCATRDIAASTALPLTRVCLGPTIQEICSSIIAVTPFPSRLCGSTPITSCRQLLWPWPLGRRCPPHMACSPPSSADQPNSIPSPAAPTYGPVGVFWDYGQPILALPGVSELSPDREPRAAPQYPRLQARR